LSFYIFEGFRCCKNNILHISSHHFDEPQCLDMVSRHNTALSIHGCRGIIPLIYVGGKNEILKQKLLLNLQRNNFPVNLAKGYRYGGRQAHNICNRAKSGEGIQLEFSTGLRKLLFINYRTRKSRKEVTPLFAELVSIIQQVIL
jgi:phage replication-related protein YjqB (UPF0714/DUF867 family)